MGTVPAQPERNDAARAARADRLASLTTLARGVSHELNNVLMPLVAYPELVTAELEEGSQAYQDVMEMKRSADAAAEIVRDLMAFARRTGYDLRPLDINERIRAVESSAAYQALKEAHASVQVRLEPGDGLWTVSGDPAYLDRALLALLRHGCEALRDAGGTLTLSTENLSLEQPLDGYEVVPAKDFVVVTMRDSGPALASEELDRIFEPYYWKRHGRSGAGLGLALVHGVVKDHGGFVDTESGGERGTVIRLYFPSVGGTSKEA